MRDERLLSRVLSHKHGFTFIDRKIPPTPYDPYWVVKVDGLLTMFLAEYVHNLDESAIKWVEFVSSRSQYPQAQNYPGENLSVELSL